MYPQGNQSPPPSSSSSSTSFPILAISLLGILTTASLLLSYYIFVIKCCLNRRRSDVIRRPWRRSRREPVTALSVYRAVARRGLEESEIRAIPNFRFSIDGGGKGSFHECSVCLNEFQAEERIRMLPNCFHVFHIDCIDIWLHTNANCPLCRSEITAVNMGFDHWLIDQILHQDEDVVIEVRDDDDDDDDGSSELMRKGRKLSMGDECIDARVKDEQFTVQPMRRSFSMDSSCDKQLHLAVQEILQQKKNPHFKAVVGGGGGGEGSSGDAGGASATSRRRFFSFGHCRSSLVLPIQDEL